MKTPLRATLAFLIPLLAIPMVFASTFSDTQSNRYQTAIQELTNYGVLHGYADGTFKPNQLINRAEFLKMMLEAFGRGGSDETNCFTDVPANAWYRLHVCTAKRDGIVKGYADGTFKPAQTINLAEALKIAFITAQVDVGTGSPWYKPYIDEADDQNILRDLLDTPDHLLTRGEAAEITYVLLRPYMHQGSSSSSVSSGAAQCGNSIVENKEQCDDGNRENGDGCSELCILVPETIRRGTLLIDQGITPLVSQIAGGRDQYMLLRFTASAGRQDVKLTSIMLEPASGSLNAASDYTLVADKNGDGIYETTIESGARTDSSKLIFDTLSGSTIPKDRSIAFEVRADISSSVSSPFALQFATDTAGYVSAIGAKDGRTLTGIETDNSCTSSVCYISVITRESGVIEVVEEGNVYVDAVTPQVRSQQVLAGGLSPTLFTMNFEATGEDIVITDIRIDGGTSDIERMQLYLNENATQPFATATTSQCPIVSATRFCAKISGEKLLIERDTEQPVFVRVDLLSEEEGAVSDQIITLSVNGSTASPAIAGYGRSSTQDINQNDGDANDEGEIFIGTNRAAKANVTFSSAPQQVVFAKISNISNASSFADNSAIPVGTAAIGTFRIDAGTHGTAQQGTHDVNLTSMRFTVTAVNVDLDENSFRIYPFGAPTFFVTCDVTSSTSTSYVVTCDDVDGGNFPNTINPGGNRIYNLEAIVLNPQVVPGSSTLAVSITGFGSINSAGSVLWTDEENAIDWVDLNQTTITSTTFRN